MHKPLDVLDHLNDGGLDLLVKKACVFFEYAKSCHARGLVPLAEATSRRSQAYHGRYLDLLCG